MGGGGGSSGPTLQQQQLETQQAKQVANLNLEENAQRKSILNAMLGTRVFRGSALSRAVAGNDAGVAAVTPTGPASNAQRNAPFFGTNKQSLVDQRANSTTTSGGGSGNTAAGGAGASGGVTAGSLGGYRGGGSRGLIP